MALCQREQPRWNFEDFAVGRATRARSEALVSTLLADIDWQRAVALLMPIAVFGPPIVCSPEFVERRRVGPEVRTAFFGQCRTAHRRHPRQ